jgi:hypothetical protein
MTKTNLIATMGAVLLFSLTAPASAQQAGGTCPTPGTAVLANVASTRDGLLPSLGREITGYGRQAQAGNCVIELVCVAVDSGDAARDVASKQCVVVRDRLVKAGFPKANIDTSRKNPGNGRMPGMVYFTVK